MRERRTKRETEREGAHEDTDRHILRSLAAQGLQGYPAFDFVVIRRKVKQLRHNDPHPGGLPSGSARKHDGHQKMPSGSRSLYMPHIWCTHALQRSHSTNGSCRTRRMHVIIMSRGRHTHTALPKKAEKKLKNRFEYTG